MPTANRERALAAAISLLATGGARALTHRQVDERAGLPAGSTSNYFRTRSALLRGVTEHMVATERPRVADEPGPASAAEMTDRLVSLYEYFVGANREMTAARLSLFIEAGRDNDLRAILADGRATFTSALRSQFAVSGARDPELATELLAVCFEGLFLHDIGGRAGVEARRIIAAIVHAALPTEG